MILGPYLNRAYCKPRAESLPPGPGKGLVSASYHWYSQSFYKLAKYRYPDYYVKERPIKGVKVISLSPTVQLLHPTELGNWNLRKSFHPTTIRGLIDDSTEALALFWNFDMTQPFMRGLVDLGFGHYHHLSGPFKLYLLVIRSLP